MLGRFCVDVVQHIFGGICGEFLLYKILINIKSINTRYDGEVKTELLLELYKR
jgi:hypothetical protein